MATELNLIQESDSGSIEAWVDEVIGKMSDLAGIAAQRRHLHAIVVVEMDMQRRQREVVMAVEFLHQAL